jgi:hypothetical protein
MPTLRGTCFPAHTATPGRCCSPASTKCFRCSAPTVAARCGPSPSSLTARPAPSQHRSANSTNPSIGNPGSRPRAARDAGQARTGARRARDAHSLTLAQYPPPGQPRRRGDSRSPDFPSARASHGALRCSRRPVGGIEFTIPDNEGAENHRRSRDGSLIGLGPHRLWCIREVCGQPIWSPGLRRRYRTRPRLLAFGLAEPRIRQRSVPWGRGPRGQPQICLGSLDCNHNQGTDSQRHCQVGQGGHSDSKCLAH